MRVVQRMKYIVTLYRSKAAHYLSKWPPKYLKMNLITVFDIFRQWSKESVVEILNTKLVILHLVLLTDLIAIQDDCKIQIGCLNVLNSIQLLFRSKGLQWNSVRSGNQCTTFIVCNSITLQIWQYLLIKYYIKCKLGAILHVSGPG